jgi:aldose 1-epimerase
VPTLSAGTTTAVIDVDDGCRLASLQFAGGLDLMGGDDQAAADSPFHHGAFPMAPWAGRIRHGRFTFEGREYRLPVNFGDHAIHGTVCDRPWEATGDRQHEWRCDLGDRWPLGGHAVHRADLRADRLRLELEVHADDAAMPVTLGWHPWFRREVGGVTAELAFSADRLYRKDEEGIPDGELLRPRDGDGPLDDCFSGLRSTPSITWPGIGRLEVESDASHLVVYTAPTSALCVEPQTGPPDAPNLGLATVVEPGRPLTAWMELRWRGAPSGTV